MSDTLVSLIPGGGNLATTELLPPDPHEFNHEIYQHRTQLYQLQIQQRAQNTPSSRVPSHVQEALNLDTAFLRFTQKLVDGLFADQIQCEKCQSIHEDWLFTPALPDDRAQLLRASARLDHLVDEHMSHGTTDEAGFYIAKLCCAVFIAELQASEYLSARMKEISDSIWDSTKPPTDNESDSQEKLRMEWKRSESDLKALYHHFLYVLKCFDIQEHSTAGNDRERAFAELREEQESFIRRTATILASSTSDQISQPRNLDGLPSRSSLGSLSPSNTDNQISQYQNGQRDSKFHEETSCDPAQDAKAVCDRLLDSLKDLNLNNDAIEESTSIGTVSDDRSTNSFELVNDAIKVESSNHREAFSKLTQSWMTRNTRQVLNSLQANPTSEVLRGPLILKVSNPSNTLSNGKEKEQATQKDDQAGLGPKRGKRAKSSSGNPSRNNRAQDSDKSGDQNGDERDEDEDDDRNRKKPRTSTPVDSRGFACPYYKRNPEKYDKIKVCSSSSWPALGRLKEHLYRYHRLPIYCPRCFGKFPNIEKQHEHLRTNVPCEIQSDPQYEGFDKEQEMRLRAKTRWPSYAEGWRAIYLILFPSDLNSPIPPHYHDRQIKSIVQYNSLVKQQLREKLFCNNHTKLQTLPALEHRLLDAFPINSNATGDQISTVIDQCLAEALRIFQLTVSEESDCYGSEESFTGDNVSLFVHTPGIEASRNPLLALSDHTAVEKTPRYGGNNRDPTFDSEQPGLELSHTRTAQEYEPGNVDFYEIDMFLNSLDGYEGAENEEDFADNVQ